MDILSLFVMLAVGFYCVHRSIRLIVNDVWVSTLHPNLLPEEKIDLPTNRLSIFILIMIGLVAVYYLADAYFLTLTSRAIFFSFVGIVYLGSLLHCLILTYCAALREKQKRDSPIVSPANGPES